MPPTDSWNGRPPFPRILVCGGRDFNDIEYVYSYLDALEPYVVIHGDCQGADRFAGKWAFDNRHLGVMELPFPVTEEEWRRLGGRAGPLRNRRMLEEGCPDLVLAFFPGGPGTKDMIVAAREAGIETWEIAARPQGHHELHE